MTKSRHRASRRGGRLRAAPASVWLRMFPEALRLHDVLTSQGFRLMLRTRPYRRSDGTVSVRFVWRKRRTRRSIEVRLNVRRQ